MRSGRSRGETAPTSTPAPPAPSVQGRLTEVDPGLVGGHRARPDPGDRGLQRHRPLPALELAQRVDQQRRVLRVVAQRDDAAGACAAARPARRPARRARRGRGRAGGRSAAAGWWRRPSVIGPTSTSMSGRIGSSSVAVPCAIHGAGPGGAGAAATPANELALEAHVEAGGEVGLEGERRRPADDRVQLDEAVDADRSGVARGLEPAAELEGVAGEGDVRLGAEVSTTGGDRSIVSRRMLASSARRVVARVEPAGGDREVRVARRSRRRTRGRR